LVIFAIIRLLILATGFPNLIYYKSATKATRNQRFLRDTLYEIRIGWAFGWDFGIDEKRAKSRG